MKIKQISIFLENKPGQLAAICRALAKADVNMAALSLADTTDFGIVRMIADDHEKGCAALAAAGFAVRQTEVVMVSVPDTPGGMADFMAKLDNAGINIEYSYAYGLGHGEKAVLIFRFSDNERACEVLAEKAGK